MKIRNKNLIKVNNPYKYFYGEDFLDIKQSYDILDWLKSSNWSLTTTDFYTQYEFRLEEKNTYKNLHYLFSKETLNSLSNFMQKLFGIEFKDNCYVVAHKLIDGHCIKIHNDYLEDESDIETHRLIIQLNDGWEDHFGGFLITFNSNDPTDIQDIIKPIHNSVFIFEISKESHHAVSTIYNANRYTLIYNFTKK